MDLPIPTHLQPFLMPIGDENSEFEVTGTICCSCGYDKFEVWESNDSHIIKLACKECRQEILLFDEGKHGWNGVVCKDDFLLNREMPSREYTCPECNGNIFGITVYISSQGKQDFLDECVSNDDSFYADDWIDAFEWITIHLSCKKCNFEEMGWIDLETM